MRNVIPNETMDFDYRNPPCLNGNIKKNIINNRNTILFKTLVPRNDNRSFVPPKLTTRYLTVNLLCKSIDWFLYDANFGV